MQLHQITHLLVDDLKLLPDKLLKQENIPVLIDVVQSVDIGAYRSSQLPPIRGFQAL